MRPGIARAERRGARDGGAPKTPPIARSPPGPCASGQNQTLGARHQPPVSTRAGPSSDRAPNDRAWPILLSARSGRRRTPIRGRSQRSSRRCAGRNPARNDRSSVTTLRDRPMRWLGCGELTKALSRRPDSRAASTRGRPGNAQAADRRLTRNRSVEWRSGSLQAISRGSRGAAETPRLRARCICSSRGSGSSPPPPDASALASALCRG